MGEKKNLGMKMKEIMVAGTTTKGSRMIMKTGRDVHLMDTREIMMPAGRVTTKGSREGME